MGASRPDRAHELLLDAALLDEARARGAWAAWNADESLAAIDPSSWRLLPLLHRRLSGEAPMLAASASTRGQALAKRARVAFEQTRYRNALLFDEAAVALRGLREAGVGVCLLKGAALCAVVYDDAALRPMSDVDLLVRPEDLARTIAVLHDSGWTSPSSLDEVEIARSHSAPFTNESRGSIDLHWRVLDTVADASGDGAVWERSRAARFAGEDVRVPCAADLLLHACVGGRRWEGDAACRWVADALAILASSGDIDWERLVAEASRHAESKGAGDALRYLRDAFVASIPAEMIVRLDRAPVDPTDALAAHARQVVPEARGPAMAIALHLDTHRRQVREGVASPGITGLARSVARTWGVSTVWLLPFHVIGRGVRRALQMVRSRARARS